MKYLLYGIAWCGFVTGNVWMGFALPGSRTASQALALIAASLLTGAVALGVSFLARKRCPACGHLLRPRRMHCNWCESRVEAGQT
jgi:hypothetical protein